MNRAEGTRQIDFVTSGEEVFFRKFLLKKWNITGRNDCFSKTQDLAKLKRCCIRSDACPVLMFEGERYIPSFSFKTQ